MFRIHHSRRKPDILLIVYALVGAALLVTLSVHFHLLDRPSTADQGHPYSDQRI